MNAHLPSNRPCLLAALSTVALLFGGGVSASRAAAPEVVGVLALALEDTVAKELELTDQQKTQLQELVDARENQAVELASQLKGLPAAEQQGKLSAFRSESEAKGLVLLTPAQRSLLEKIRLGRLGMAALEEPAIAEQLILTQEQKTQVSAILNDRGERLARADEKMAQVIRAETERRLAGLLSKQQQAAWEELTWRQTPPLAPAKTEIAKAEATLPVAVEPKDSMGPKDKPAAEAMPPEIPAPEPGEKGPAEKEPPEQEPSEPAEKPAEKQVRLRFNFHFAPWKEVLNWFADQAGLSLQTEIVPPGTFNYRDDREYTPAEAIDVLNSVLLTKGFTLVRRDRALMLISFQDPMPPLPTIAPEQLEGRGDSEMVSVLFQLEKLTPEQAEQEVKKLLGPKGEIITLTMSRQIQVTDLAGRLKTVRGVIRRIENPESTDTDLLQTFELRHLTPAEALAMLRPFLGIPEDKNAALDGSICIAMDPSGKRLLASGNQKKLSRLEKILKIIDVSKDDEAELSQLEKTPQLVVYNVTKADPDAVLQVIQTLVAGLPDVRIAKDPKTGNLIALARPAQHATIRETISQMEGQEREFVVIHLHTVDPQLAVQGIVKLFGSGGDPAKGPVNPNAPQVDADPTSRNLFVRATKVQIDQIRTLLQKMGEDETKQAEPSNSTVRMVPLKGQQAIWTLEQAEKIWPSLKRNPIRVITPSSSTIPTVRPSGGEEPAPPGESEAPPPGPERPPADGGASPVPRGPGEQGKPLPPATRAIPSADKSAGLPGRSSDGRVRLWFVAQPAEPLAEEEPIPAAVTPGPGATPPKPPVLPRAAAGLPAVDARVEEGPAPLASPPTAGNGTSAQQPPSAEPGPRKEPPPIFVIPGPNGLMIACEDPEVLNEFEKMLKSISEGTEIRPGGPEITVFYLKHAKATAVAEILDRVFSGTASSGSSSGGPGGGGMLGGLAGAALGEAGGGILGSLLGLGGEGTITPTGSIKITPDPRLNALIVQANPTDVATIEQLLKILDQEGGDLDIAVQPKTRIIEVKNTQAEEIAMVLKEVYQDRMIAAGGQAGRPPSPQELMQQMFRGGGGRRGGGPGGQRGPQEEPQKMAVGVDARTNSIILVAPEPLFTEVQQLIEQLDQRALKSNQTMEIITLDKANPDIVQQALHAIAGDAIQFGRSMSYGPRTRVQAGRPGQLQQGFGGRMTGGFPQQGGMRMQTGASSRLGQPTAAMYQGRTGGYQPQMGGAQPQMGGYQAPTGGYPMQGGTPGYTGRTGGSRSSRGGTQSMGGMPATGGMPRTGGFRGR